MLGDWTRSEDLHHKRYQEINPILTHGIVLHLAHSQKEQSKINLFACYYQTAK